MKGKDLVWMFGASLLLALYGDLIFLGREDIKSLKSEIKESRQREDQLAAALSPDVTSAIKEFDSDVKRFSQKLDQDDRFMEDVFAKKSR